MRAKKAYQHRRRWGIYLWPAMLIFLWACSEFRAGEQREDVDAIYHVQIRRTQGGIPHIKTEDFASLGYGSGYAAAEDNVCLLAENFLRYRGELSRYLGPDKGNLESDFAYKLLIERGLTNLPVAVEMTAIYRGYAAGYNRYLREVGRENIPDSSCRGAEWVRAITQDDIRRIDQTPFFFPIVSQSLVAAAPPADSSASLVDEYPIAVLESLDYITNPDDKGSNGIALGREVTEQGRGLVLANPHWVWTGNQRYYPRHHTIPGILDVLGAHTVEKPLLETVGVTEHVTWTVTMSSGKRMAFYQLQLAPGQPTRYVFDGEPHDMRTDRVTVSVRNDDGSLQQRSHTFYSTDFGFMVGQFPWSADKAFAVRIAHEGARGASGGVLEVLRAKSVRELKAIHDRYQFLPANLIAADSSGEVLYAQTGPLAHITDTQTDDCTVSFEAATPFASVLDGSRSECQWGRDADAAVPGIFGARNLPSLFRTDYATNSNDSHWLANPEQPLSGFDQSLGIEDSQRTLRTRSGLQMIQQRLDGSDGLGGERFNRDKVLALLVRNQNYAGQLLRDGLVTLCEANSTVTLPDGAVVDISEACPILAAWDLRANIQSRGAHLFREFLREANKGNDRWRWLPKTLNYTVPFDPSDPVNTPRGLDTRNNPLALQALAKAVKKLRDASIALDARLGDLQTVTRNGEVIPIHGGPEMEGVFNKITSDFQGSAGYPKVTGSSSGWISATEFTDHGPAVKAILTYSISTNSASPHFADQTKMFSRKEWLDIPFREEEVAAATLQSTVLTEGVNDCYSEGWKAFKQPKFGGIVECRAYFDSLKAARVTAFTTR